MIMLRRFYQSLHYLKKKKKMTDSRIEKIMMFNVYIEHNL